ncbi:MAG: transposase, partial [Gemmatimonadetes bacterium]|nr:transposase [Gemmatimonadota bacterium]
LLVAVAATFTGRAIRMHLVPPSAPTPLPRLLAYAQTLGLERYLGQAKRGVPALALALDEPLLAWRGSGRPQHLADLDEPLLAALLGAERLPCPQTLRRSLAHFAAHDVRRAVETAYLAEWPRRAGRVWAAIDAHQLPYWGRGKRDRFQKGWAGAQGRPLRGYRLYLAVDTDSGQIITDVLVRGGRRDHQLLALLTRRVRTLLGRRLAGVVADCGFTSRASVAAMADTGVPFILGFARSAPIRRRLAALSGQQRRGRRDGGAIRLGACPWDTRLRLFALGARTPDDRRGPGVSVTNLRSAGPRRLAATYRRRWRAEPAIEELLNGHDLDHLVSYRLHPNQVAVGFRLLARNLAIGHQIAAAQARPAVIREPRAFRASRVEGPGTFSVVQQTIVVTPLRAAADDQPYPLPWTQRAVHYAA